MFSVREAFFLAAVLVAPTAILLLHQEGLVALFEVQLDEDRAAVAAKASDSTSTQPRNDDCD
jgi:hypothetical protein